MNTTINRSVTLHEGRIFRLVRENVTLENGVTIDLDIDEILHVYEIRFDDAVEMVHRGEIEDGKTISGLFISGLFMAGIYQ